MSSTYRAICAAHTPPLELTYPEWQSVAEAIYAAYNREGVLGDHARCLLYVGAYSYPLISLACVGGANSDCAHPQPQWAETDTLRMAVLGLDAAEGSPMFAAARSFARGCWTPERLRALRPILLDEPVKDGPDCQGCGEKFSLPWRWRFGNQYTCPDCVAPRPS